MAYRVIQWATGATGTYALRSIIQNSNTELVGLYVHSAEKTGVDAGDLCRLKPACWCNQETHLRAPRCGSEIG